MLDFADEALNQVEFFDQMGIKVPLFKTIFARRNDRDGSVFIEPLQEIIGIIGTVGNDIFTLKLNIQRFSLGDVMALIRRQGKPQRIPWWISRIF